MVGFVAGLPFLFQLVDREHQLEVPKYLSPRTDTPALTIGHGGCFSCIYSVRGAGGYQMFGVAAAPIYDPTQALSDFSDFMVFFNPGDIVKFRPVDEAEYQRIRAEVEAGTFRYRQAPITFHLGEAWPTPKATTRNYWRHSMAFEIREQGLSTTVQDQGRIGYYRFGIPQGGSMDQYSASLANAWSATPRPRRCWNAPTSVRSSRRQRMPSSRSPGHRWT